MPQILHLVPLLQQNHPNHFGKLRPSQSAAKQAKRLSALNKPDIDFIPVQRSHLLQLIDGSEARGTGCVSIA